MRLLSITGNILLSITGRSTLGQLQFSYTVLQIDRDSDVPRVIPSVNSEKKEENFLHILSGGSRYRRTHAVPLPELGTIVFKYPGSR